MDVPPLLRDLYRDDHPQIVIQKSAQVGISEYLVNSALWAAHTGQGGRGNALYVMPTASAMDDFSEARIHKAIQDAPPLSGALRNPAQRGHAHSRRLTRLGKGYIYCRPDTERQLISVDADIVLLDEVDRMEAATLPLAEKRLGSSTLGWLRAASTPTLPEVGIHALFAESDQRRYLLPCCACGEEQPLTWEANVDHERAKIICRRCRTPLDVRETGRWVPTRSEASRRGYHVSRLYVPGVDLSAMIRASRSTDPAVVREFHNSDLGEPWTPAGSGLAIADLDACRSEYAALQPPIGATGRGIFGARRAECFMGVDVGRELHVAIRERADGGWALIYVGAVPSFQEIDWLYRYFYVTRAIVDALPEQQLAREWVAQANQDDYSEALIVYYGRQRGDHNFDWNAAVPTVQANRALAFDQTLERFRQRQNLLPREARELGGNAGTGIGAYYRQLLAPIRVMHQDGYGDLSARYESRGQADHFAHAEVYCTLATLAPRRPQPKREPVGLSFAFLD